MLFVTIVAIMFLCVLDALLTLYLMTYGASEINPFMAYLLNIGPSAFIIPKFSITMLATFGLFMFRDVVVRKLNVGTTYCCTSLGGFTQL